VGLFSVASDEIKDENRTLQREFRFVYDIYRLDGKTAHIMRRPRLIFLEALGRLITTDESLAVYRLSCTRKGNSSRTYREWN